MKEIHVKEPRADFLPYGQAMLAWLADGRVREAEGNRRQWLESLRLRALVALNLWGGLSAATLVQWSLEDYEALKWHELSPVWNKWHSLFVWMPDRLADGPKAAVHDWIEAAGIVSGLVFRRIHPGGVVSERSLDEVGIASLLGGLAREGVSMGVINRQFAFDFSRREDAPQPVLNGPRELAGPSGNNEGDGLKGPIRSRRVPKVGVWLTPTPRGRRG